MPFDNTPTEIIVDTPTSLILEAAITLIERPGCWCRGVHSAYLSDGMVAYCALGAAREAWAAAGPASNGESAEEWAVDLFQADHALNAAARVRGYADVADLNDDPSTTHAMVLEVMREAVEIARGKP